MNLKRNVPDNAAYLTSITASILCLANLGSTFAFNISVSLTFLCPPLDLHDLHWLRSQQSSL